MVHLILTGATGLVGSACLTHILSLPAGNAITKLSILSRSPVPLIENHPKRTNNTTEIEVIHHTDYNNYPSDLLAKLKGANGVIWAQGISQMEVSKADYLKITIDYPLAAAKAFSTLPSKDGDKLNFVYVSGTGATHTPGRFTQQFARVKGQAELAILALGKQAPYDKTLRPIITRPAGVDGSSQPEIWKPIMQRRGTMYRTWFTPMLYVVRATYKNMMSPTPELGKVLVDLAMADEAPLKGKGVECDGQLVTNIGLRDMGGLPT